MRLKNQLAAILCSALMLCGFSQEALASKIGVIMPGTDVPRWITDGNFLKETLEGQGLEVLLTYSDNSTQKQINDINQMLQQNIECLVITPVDGNKLIEVLQEVKKRNIPVISYDRLILGSDAVDYYATFDNYRVGQLQGTFIEDRLRLKDDNTPPQHIEIFTGSLDDNNVNFLYAGCMEILKPYISSGKLIVKSHETEKQQVSTYRWLEENAKVRMVKLIETMGYGPSPDKQKLDAVVAPNDNTANGIIRALRETGKFKKKDMPVITGQDCSATGARNIKKGWQSMCVFKDSRVLADQVAKMVMAILNKTDVPVNDTTSYDNGVKKIPSYLCTPLVVTKDNLNEMLIESGYHDAKVLR